MIWLLTSLVGFISFAALMMAGVNYINFDQYRKMGFESRIDAKVTEVLTGIRRHHALFDHPPQNAANLVDNQLFIQESGEASWQLSQLDHTMGGYEICLRAESIPFEYYDAIDDVVERDNPGWSALHVDDCAATTSRSLPEDFPATTFMKLTF